MAARPILGLVSLILLAGGILLQFFVILSGAVSGSIENKVYFLQASTNGIKGARNPSRWTFFAICGVDGANNANCGKVVPALPFNPPGKSNFGTTTGVPAAFVGTHTYYYLSRFMFAFFIIALFFAVCALFTGLLALCTRLGAYMSSLTTSVALFFQTLAAALMTAWTVKAQKAFKSAGQDASLGKYAYGFTWAAVACFFLAMVLFCAGGRAGKDTSTGSGKSRFGRKRSTRSRGSFVGSDRGGIKDDYS